MVEIKELGGSGFTRRDLFCLAQESFQERVRQGVVYSICRMPFEVFERYTQQAIIYIAVDSEAKELLGLPYLYRIGMQGVVSDGCF